MSSMFERLRHDESGALYSTEKMLVSILLGLGLIAGLAALRDGVVQEIGDAAVALDSLDQTYTFTVQTAGGGTQTSSFSASVTLTDPVDGPPAGLSLGEAPVAE